MEEIYLFMIIGGVAGVFIAFGKFARENKEKEKNEEEIKQVNERRANRKSIEIETNFKKLEFVDISLQSLEKLELPKIKEYKQALSKNEKNIVAKGGDSAFFKFMKINTFLSDFEGRIRDDKNEILENFELESIKARVLEEASRDDIDKIVERLDDINLASRTSSPISFQGKLDLIGKICKSIVPSFQNHVSTLKFYENIAIAMLAFYLHDNRIHFYEIDSAFEKLGVYDSTWQKDVLRKLDKIEARLSNIESQLTELNSNFQNLLESNNQIISELKDLNDQLITTNLLEAITAFQLYSINKKLK